MVGSKEDQIIFNFVSVHWIHIQLNFQCYLFTNTLKCFLALGCFVLKLDHEKINFFYNNTSLKVAHQQFFLSNPHTDKIYRIRDALAFLAHLCYGCFKTTYITAGLSRVNQAPKWLLRKPHTGTISCARYRRRQIFSGIQ